MFTYNYLTMLPILIGAGALLYGAYKLLQDSKIFVTYDYENDRNYKNMLVAWSKNASFNIAFHDKSVDVSVDSDDQGVIRRVVSSRIGESTHVLCIVGKDTWRSKWVQWEIEKAKELGKPLIAVKVGKSCRAPKALLSAGAKWAHSYNFDSIKKAISAA